VEYGERFKLRDVIGCWIDMDEMKLGYCLNGQNLGEAFSFELKHAPQQDPKIPLFPLFPSFSISHFHVPTTVLCSKDMKFPPPFGYLPLGDHCDPQLICMKVVKRTKPGVPHPLPTPTSTF